MLHPPRTLVDQEREFTEGLYEANTGVASGYIQGIEGFC